jgi:zinc/manganese transport system substrate-binding protein
MTSFSILADITRQIGGDLVEVESLVGPDADAHAFQPQPGDARRLGAAQLVVVNGLGFEGWLERLVKASGFKGSTVVASRGVKPLAGRDAHGHSHGSDPHAWHNAANGKLYARNIGDALATALPAHAEKIKATTDAYVARLDALDAEIRSALAALPRDKRKAVTSHDSFGYFAAAYGVTFLAPAGISTQAEPSAADVGRLIRQIRTEKIGAVFIENIHDRRLLDRVAGETGARIGGKLYSDALSLSGGPADTYEAMLRSNLRTLLANFGG